MNDQEALQYFSNRGVRTWGELARYFQVDMVDLYGDEDIEASDMLTDCDSVTEWAVADKAMSAGQN